MRRILIGLALAVVLPLLPAGPAVASAAGSIVVSGEATLPRFPCPPPYLGQEPCYGSFTGEWAGHAAGLDVGGGAYDVTWARLGGIEASFTYFELQCVEPSTVLGAAIGSGSATAGPGSVRGDWSGGPLELPRPITGVRLSFTFTWSRFGTTAVITLDTFLLEIEVAGVGWRVASQAAPPGTATFVPMTFTGVHQPSCAAPLTDVKGRIAGVLPLAA